MALWESMPCQTGWLPTNHILFHFANVCLFLSYCAPPGLKGLLFLRIVLFFACFLFAWWGWMVLCAMDTFVWNAIFTIMNLAQSYITYTMIPRSIKFSEEVESLYSKLLAPLRISKEEFEVVYNAAHEVIYLKSGQIFEVSHLCDTISLVIQGRIAVLHEEKPFREYFQFEFVNPATCFGDETDEDMEFTAVDTRSIVLIWRRTNLQNVLQKDPHLKVVFQGLAARQLLSKPKPKAEYLSVHPMLEAPISKNRISVDEKN